ncbi:MAG: DNA-binding response regulator [Crocinitomicaceae bacterium]|nr:DNA-binding response regulator [Crocinitomicaceae bacterium]|tara:strand:+ start:4667 stop:5359 length:693 start_codon:yes stop_codon:yes gene_type:complete
MDNTQEEKSNHKILLVDDEPDIVDLIKYNLEKEGYVVSTASNGVECLSVAKSFSPDLILLDVMMPEMDGIETCMQIREDKELKNTLVALLTARSEDYSQIAGFESGADDYITKPIKPRVLVSRIKALLRRKEVKNTTEKVSDELSIDEEKYVAIINGEEKLLPKKEFELLALLFSKPGKVFTREVILNKVWGDDIVVGDRTIDVHIRKLREKIGDSYIKTVKGVGYKLKI